METVLPMLEKRLDGFEEYSGFLCYDYVGSAWITSRVLGGVVGSTLLLCILGSLNAVSLVMEKIIIPQLGRMVLEVSS